MQEKARCRDFALGLRCEAAVRSNNFPAIQALIQSGFNPNTPVDYIHIDSAKEKQVASLVKLSYHATRGSQIAAHNFVKYLQQNGPIPILELAVRYKKIPLVKQLTPLSNAEARQKALEAAVEIGAKKIVDYLSNYRQQNSNTEL